MLKKLSLILTIIACFSYVSAQELLWNVDFNTVLNNREGGDELCPDQTIFFTRLAPEVGITIDNGRNRIMGGATWFQPLNDQCTGYKIVPTLYYRFDNGKFNVELGMFPRAHMHERLPRYLWSDSLNYCQPNVRGAMFQYQHQRGGWLQAVLDWRQMQTATRREAFNFTMSGAVPLTSHLWAEGHLYYNHLAKHKYSPEDEGVIDDATINPMLSLRTTAGATDWRVSAGAIIQLQRERNENKWHNPTAFTSTVNAQWKWIEVEESFTAGKNLFPLYDRFGPELNLGNPYYCSKVYSRTDLTAHVVRNYFVDLTATLTFHATDHCTGFWQQIACRFYIDSDLWKNKSDKHPPLKSLF